MYKKLLFLIVLSGCGTPEEKKQGNSQPLFSVDYIVVKNAPFQEVFITQGDVIPNEMVSIQSEVNAKITGIHFAEGQSIKKGQLLFTLHDKEIQAQLKSTTARYQLAKNEAERRKQLLAVNGISAEEYEIAASQVLQLEGEKEFLEAQLEQYKIFSPLGGKAGLRMYSLGALVSPGNILTTLVEDYPVKIEFELPERFYSEIKQSDIIQLTIKGTANEMEAEVYAKDPQIDANTRSFTVRAINYDKNQKVLVPGKFVQVSVRVQRADESIMIPTDALMPDRGAQKVFLYKGGKAISKNVVPGYRGGEKIEILEGIDAGDTLITSGLLTLRPEAQVQLRTKKTTQN